MAWALRDRLFELHHSLLGLPDVAQDCRQNSAAAPVSSALMHTAPPTRPSIAGNRPAQQMLSIGPLVDVVVPEDYISE